VKDPRNAVKYAGQPAARTPEELIDEPTLADDLGASHPTVITWRRNGTGPDYIRVGRLIRYRPSDVERWLEERTQRQSSDVAK
jgi:predicted DNA-binding transcriptional regulator AlpA